MGNITNVINAAFPDGPSNAPAQPFKPTIRQIGPAIEADLGAIASGIVAGSAVLYQTRDLLYADLAKPANTLGMVWGDPNPALNGFYIKYGASGTGGWYATGVAVPSTVSAQIADLQVAVLALQNGDLGKAAADIPSANQIDITNILGDYARVTGNQTIQYFTAARIGLERTIFFTGSPILKHSDFIRLPGNADITVQAGDVAIFRCVDENRWRCVVYTRINGKPVIMPDVNDIPGLSTIVTQATALRDQAAASAAAAAGSQTSALAASNLATDTYNDVLDFVSSGLEVLVNVTGDGTKSVYDLLQPLPAVNGFRFANVYVGGDIQKKDGLSYTITNGGTKIQLAANLANGVQLYAEKAQTLAAGPVSGVFPSIRNKGGVGGGANDTVPANASIAAEGEVYLPAGDWQVDSTFENRLGGRVYGPGRMLLPTQKGSRQLNSYADDGQRVFGLEYGSAYFKRLMAGSPITMVFSGDSTTQGGEFETFIPIMARDNGVSGISVFNRGYSGQTLAWWLANRMGVDLNDPEYGVPHAYLHRWGINDPASGRTLAQIADDLWTGLAAIRTSLSVSQLTIFLCVPNAAVLDPQRTEAWFEGLYRIYRNAARKFQCVLIDVYGFMRDIRTTSDWADSINNGDGDIGHIHPDAFGRAMIRTLYEQALFPAGIVSTSRRNRIWNVSGTEAGYVTPSAATPPSFFPEGITLGRAQGSTNNWPIDGLLVTVRGRDGIAYQTITSWAEPNAIQWFRTNTQSGSHGDRYTDWAPWVNMAGPAPVATIPTQNGWVTFDAAYNELRCGKDAANRVLVNGVIKGGTIPTVAGSSTVVGILPTGFRPPKILIFLLICDGGKLCQMQILTNGEMRIYPAIAGTAITGASASWTSLDGIMFTAA